MAGRMEKQKGIKETKIMREPFSGTMIFTTGLIAFFKILREIKKFDPDIIHAHQTLGFFYYLYRLVKKSTIPLVFHLHTTNAERLRISNKNGNRTPLIKKYVELPLGSLSDRMGVKAASVVICPSDRVKKEVIKYYQPGNSDKVVVVENGANTELFSQDDQMRNKKRGELNFSKKKVILHHGAIIRRKNAHLLIEALELLSEDYILVIQGPGNKKYLKYLRQEAEMRGLSDRVRFIGYIPYPKMPDIFRAADIFALTSEYEGLPKVVMQALSCGTPCVVSGFVMSRKIGGLEFVKNLKPKTIAKKIKDICDNKTKVDIKLMVEEYSWDEKAREIEEVYKNLASQEPCI